MRSLKLKDNVVLEKSKKFAIRIVNLYKHLCNNKNEYVLSKQLLRSGTSIGANISEAIYSISKKEFLAKMYIAYKECGETKYWIDLLYETDFLNKEEYLSIVENCTEVQKLLSAITKTTKEQLNNN